MGTPSNQYVGNEPLLNSVYNDKDSVVKAKSSFINRWKLVVAFVFLIGLVICWISMAEILQSVQKGTNDYHYDKPYFMVYVIHSSYTIFLIICIIWKLIEFLIHKYRSIDTPYTLLDTVRLKRRILVAFCVNPIMMTCAYVWYLSLPLTTISANTGIYNSSCVFVYLFSCLILGEKLKIAKVISVMICIGGVAVMALSHPSVSKDNKDDSVKSVVEGKPKKSDEFVGYLLVILSTALYAMYEVLYKKFVDVKQHQLDTLSDSEKTAILHQNSTNNSQDQHQHHSSGLNDTFNTMLFLGLTGLFTLLLFWPIILILHYTKFEVFEYPSDIVWKVISINCGLDSVFNILLLITIMLTSPLFVSVGSLLTIPTSIVADYLFHKLIPYWMSLVGAGLIVIGFLGLNITEYLHEKRLREELTNPNTTKKSFFQRHFY